MALIRYPAPRTASVRIRIVKAPFVALATIALAVMCAVTSAAAQTGSSIITGTVRDHTGAVVQGAAIVITAPTLIGGEQATATNAEGVYRFSVLPSGTYAVSVQRDGFRTVRRADVRVPSSSSVVIDFSLELAAIEDRLEVQGRSPMVDVKSASVPTRLDADLLHNLPTSRSYASLINLVPGISADVSFGGSQKSNEILVDGVRGTEPLFQDPVMRINQNWVEELQVVSLGATAEHGGFSGAAALATLRSGTNRFNGLGEFWTTQPGWLASNTGQLSESLQKRFLSRQIFHWNDSSAQAGGPIRRDRLWFFSGLQFAQHEDRPAGFNGPGSRAERDLQFVFKPTASLSPRIRVDGFASLGQSHVDGEYIAADTPIETSNDVRQGQISWNARSTWAVSDATVAEFRHGGYDIRHVEDPHAPSTRLGPAPRYDAGTNVYSINTTQYFEQHSRIHTTSAALTHFTERFGTSHELKIGIEYEATRARQQYGFPGDRFYVDLFGEPNEVTLAQGTAGTASTGRSVTFAQDVWSVNGRLTVTPGIRLEFNRGSVPGKSNVFRTNTVAPRIGAAWELGDDHRTVVRAHYGRYFDPIFASRIMQDDLSETYPVIRASVIGPDQFVEISRTSPAGRFQIDQNIKHSNVDQIVAGVERELFTDFSLQTQYIRRRFGDFMGMIDTGTNYRPATGIDPGPDGRLNTADDGGSLSVFAATNPGARYLVYTNPAGAYNRYDAVQVVARKRYSRNWQMQSSYTWSKNRGTVGNRWHVNAARFDLGSPGRFVNPNSNINAFGRAAFDPTHEVKLLGSYRVPGWGGTMLSGVYRYTTGQAWGRRAFIRGLPQGNENVRIEPVGTRRTPALNNLALRAEKTLVLRRAGRTLGLFVEAFNLWNQGVPNADAITPVVDNSNLTFGEPLAWLDPRMFRAGIRLAF